MMFRWRSIAAVLLAPVLVLAVTASSFLGLRCRMTGMVSLDACCSAPDPRPLPEQSSVGEAGCCESVVVANAKPLAARPTPADVALVPVAVAWISAIAAPVASRPDLVSAPLRVPKPPLRLLKQSLLI
jgi:hypothetical protein